MPDVLNFAERAWLEEQIDGPCSFEELRDCLRDLARVNRLVLSHRPILQWLNRIAPALPRHRPIRIVDIGCGYGDMLRRIERWGRRSGLALECIGVDINAHAIRAAREATPSSSQIQWVLGDVTRVDEAAHADLITSCGVMHHLAEPEIVRILAWTEQTARAGWFLCDLHRQPVPYRIFDLLMRFGHWHRFIRPDGLTSIRRSFLAEDWQRMGAAAGLAADSFTIDEYRPARLCVERMKLTHAEALTE